MIDDLVKGLTLAALDGEVDRRGVLTDAIVMVLAAEKGDVVYTSDLDDLTRIRDARSFDVKLFGI